ncbi:ribonuclease H1 [Elysia marginata]|uniref:Ribonuclease H1 n=1 Tax=Elysia marginata TaxID=1093978 RepID=A0AAV4EQ63_9GAST|nr:ribonuclease H1 [Elysia marginata]
MREGLQEVKNKGSTLGNIVILSDSLSATTSLTNLEDKHARPDLAEETTHIAQELREQQQITVCWIPSHCDTKGNEMADQRAKEGLENENNKYQTRKQGIQKHHKQENKKGNDRKNGTNAKPHNSIKYPLQ